MASPFKSIMVKVRINERKLRHLEGLLGVQTVMITRQQDAVKRQRHENAVGERQYMRFGGREDATGTVRGDTGRPVFTFEGAKHEAVSLESLQSDLANAGYVLGRVALKQKEDDRMGILELVFLPAGTTEQVDTLEFTLDALQAVSRELSRSFGHLHVWDNRSSFGTATVNPAHALPEQDVAKIADPRTLRFSLDAEGNPHWRNMPVGRQSTEQCKYVLFAWDYKEEAPATAIARAAAKLSNGRAAVVSEVDTGSDLVCTIVMSPNGNDEVASLIFATEVAKSIEKTQIEGVFDL